MSKAKEFTQNAFFMSSSNVFNMFVALASMYFYTRILIPLELALIPVLEILASIVYVLSNLGFGLYVQRRMPAMLEKRITEARSLARLYTLVTCVGSVFFCSLLFLAADSIAIAFLKTAELSWQIRLLIPGVLVTCIWTLMTQIFLGASMFTALSVFSMVSQVLHPLAIIGFYLYGGTTGMLIGLAAGKGIVCLLFCWHLREYLFGGVSLKGLGRTFREAWPYHLEGIINYPMNFADRWLVGLLLTPVALATYYVPRTMYERLTNLLKSVTNVMLASMAMANAEGPLSAQRVFNRFCRVCIFLFVPLATGLMCLSYYLVDLLAGPKYHAGILPFGILMLALLVQGLFTPHYLGLVTLLPPKKRLVVVSFQAVAVFVFVATLGYLFALDGVAMARVFIMLTSGGLSIYYLRVLFPIHMDVEGLKTTLFPVLTLCAVLICGQLLWYNQIAVPVYALLGYLAYVLLFLRKVSEQDFNALMDIVPARLSPLSTWARRFRGTRPDLNQ